MHALFAVAAVAALLPIQVPDTPDGLEIVTPKLKDKWPVMTTEERFHAMQLDSRVKRGDTRIGLEDGLFLFVFWDELKSDRTETYLAKVADSRHVGTFVRNLGLDIKPGKPLQDFKVAYYWNTWQIMSGDEVVPRRIGGRWQAVPKHDHVMQYELALEISRDLPKVGINGLSDDEKKFYRKHPAIFAGFDPNIRRRRIDRRRSNRPVFRARKIP